MNSNEPDSVQPKPEPRRGKIRWRPRLRRLHRDVGYALVGLTFVYALSGLAVNHIDDWDPNFSNVKETVEVESVPRDPKDVAALALNTFDIDAEHQSTSETHGIVDVVVDERTVIRVDRIERTATLEEREPRFLLRAANWLHLNRGKAAWTFIADGYAILLLFLALSGLFMNKGKNGLAGSGWIYLVAGFLVPIFFVLFSPAAPK